MTVAATAVQNFLAACAEYQCVFSEPDARELILGVRSRLKEVAQEGSHEEQVNAAVFVLQPFLSEFRHTAAGQGLDDEAFSLWLWESFVAAGRRGNEGSYEARASYWHPRGLGRHVCQASQLCSGNRGR